jgi:hypothetical protein
MQRTKHFLKGVRITFLRYLIDVCTAFEDATTLAQCGRYNAKELQLSTNGHLLSLSYSPSGHSPSGHINNRSRCELVLKHLGTIYAIRKRAGTIRTGHDPIMVPCHKRIQMRYRVVVFCCCSQEVRVATAVGGNFLQTVHGKRINHVPRLAIKGVLMAVILNARLECIHPWNE